MRDVVFSLGVLFHAGTAVAGPSLPQALETHCFECHNADKAKGKFELSDLGETPSAQSIDRWLEALDLIEAGEMPPGEDSEITEEERAELAALVQGQLGQFELSSAGLTHAPARRMNNREFARSIADVLLIEDVGTHLPVANLIGDSLHEGFDTHAETLGFSKFHLEQYLEAVRKIVDATVLSGRRPEAERIEIRSEQILAAHTRANTKRPERRGTAEGFDFLDPKQRAYFEPFQVVPETGRYRMVLRVTGKDRNRYDPAETGIHPGDPIRLHVELGDRVRRFELPDEKVMEIELDEWLAAGSRVRLHYPTDGLTLRSNGNFKFQIAIAGAYLKENDPERYQRVVDAISPKHRVRSPDSWHHWTNDWEGPRPRIFDVAIEGPLHETWPPERQVALLGKKPSMEKAEAILRPIAERAWRRSVREGELDRIIKLVYKKAESLGAIEALKEGIVAILVHPAFLLLQTEDLTPEDRFASKFSYFLASTTPDKVLQEAVAAGKLNDFESVRGEVARWIESGRADPFLDAFVHGWLKLNDINFMAPDPDQYRFYHRKRLSEDMVQEAKHFFRHIVAENAPVSEMLEANYSFLNADLAELYQVDDVPQDSELRKHSFEDGRRGGLLGMGAFLTATADSLSTSPIHRAVYVMENFLGLHPTPPPPDVIIEEPDVRQARTIKEVLEKHRSDANCASCHESIDPFGYAFENFDSTGAWRDDYIVPKPPTPDTVEAQKAAKNAKESEVRIPIDASYGFRSGETYQDVKEFREIMLADYNRDRFVRCFITKLLTYANGCEPEAKFAIEQIFEQSAKHDHRIVDTIAAVIDSPLFRGK